MDDTELWLNIPDKNITQLVTDLQDIAQHHKLILNTACGALEM